MENAFIRKGHGYEVTATLNSHLERCTAFDGFEVIASPLGGFDNASRESRVWKAEGASYGVTYGSHAIQLAIDVGDLPRGLYILMQNGCGREVLRIGTGPHWRAMRDALLAMPERLLYSFLYSIWSTADSARSQAAATTQTKWAQAFVDGRIRKRRSAGRVTISVETPFEKDLRTGKAKPGRVAIDTATGEVSPVGEC